MTVTAACMVMLVLTLPACAGTGQHASSAEPGTTASPSAAGVQEVASQLLASGQIPEAPPQPASNDITMAFGDVVVTAALDNSETTQAFLATLPQTFSMSRYGDREYYAAIPALPEDGEAIADFENGDITYYTTGKSLAIFFGNAESSSQGDLIRMGKITSDLSVFSTFGDTVEVTILPSDAQGGEAMNGEEQEVLAAYQARLDGMVAMDVDALGRMMADDLTLHHITGATQTKEEWLACIANEEMRYYNIDLESVEVEVHGDAAVVRHTATLDARIYGSCGTSTLSGESSYEKRDGNWVWVNA